DGREAPAAEPMRSDSREAPADDPRPTLGRALDQAGMVVAHVTPDQAGHPTPCQSWDVNALANHLINGLDRFRSTVMGEQVDWGAPLPDIDGEWASVFHDRADALMAAWAEVPDIDAKRPSPMGELSMSFIAGQQIAEIAQHTWDLAAATGQRDTLDDTIAGEALAWTRGALSPEFRGPEASGNAFGDERPVAADAPVCDQLAAFFGRDPAFVGEPS
ncbi:MAG TPA: TIGR03086 family metal-binding protein, partial [Micromonosporaceae bacterium]|nr:TIGR03086 family metal-binding protein [Micromonosporaceae bacterium]